MKKRYLLVVVAALIASACTTTGGSSGPASVVNTASGASHAPVTLNVWSFYSNRELKDYSAVLKEFTDKYPWITIQHTPGKQPKDFVAAINSGTSFDVAISAGPDNVAKYCSTGAFQNLSPYMKAQNMDISKIIPPQALRYTSYQGVQCTLPVLSDAYGLYYNKDMFQQKGVSSVPKTLSELETDAKKLTVLNPDGSIKVAGFVPLGAFYENPALYQGDYSDGKWYDSNGKSAFASDPSWASLLTWQKNFITDVYGPDGYHKLLEFTAPIYDLNGTIEFSPRQGFETGKIAMTIDGEWRTAFIKNDKSTVNYGTAPFPVADNIASTYGRGQIGGDTIGIPRTAQNPSEAWLLTSYLATNTQAQEQLAVTLGNVPTTYAALKDPVLNKDPRFKTFLNIFANPLSGFKQLTPLGDYDTLQWTAFIGKWEAGNVPDLQTGLQGLATNIDDQAQLG
jgi:multiple sugar transport system substrate-binding protein